MDKQKIKNALEFESIMYGAVALFSFSLGATSVIHASFKNKVSFLLLGLIGLFIAYLSWKRVLYLTKLGESITK